MATITGTAASETLPGTSFDDNITALAGDDKVFGGDGFDFIFGGDNNASTFEAFDNDELHGGGNTDVIFGELGADKLFGEDGNDTLAGGAGADRLDGGVGTDGAFYADATAGVSVSLAFGTGGGAATGDTLISIENVTGSNFADRLLGNRFANDLGGLGGNDILEGAAGNDRLSGNAGKDTHTGGADADQFFFGMAGSVADTGVGSNRDVITDFKQTESDKINLSGIDARSSVGGDQAFSFIDGRSFTAEGQLRALDLGSTVVLQGNTDADSAAEFEIEVQNFTSSFVTSDLVL